MNIKTRLIVFYSLFFVVSVIGSTLVYQQIYRRTVLENVKVSSRDTTQSITNQVEKELNTVNNYSKIILSDSTVQQFLRQGNSDDRVLYMRDVERFVDELMTNFDEIYSVYLIDSHGNKYFNDRMTDLEDNPREYINLSDDARWLNDALSLDGGGSMVIDGDDFFLFPNQYNIVSCIRVINDLDTQMPIGILILNIEKSYFEEAIHHMADQSTLDVIIKDKHGKPLNIIELNPDEVNQDDYIFNNMDIENYGWHVTTMTKIISVDKGSQLINATAIGLILITGLILFAGSAFMASKLTKPIFQLSKEMEDYVINKDTHVELDSNYPEFKQLEEGYNRMSDDIHRLFQSLKNEQKVKRKAELKALQAQIKPHFLYNTFDSVCGLALMEDYDGIYNMMTSLGQFYKLSLSKGREIITIKEELAIAKHYMEIQRIRYPNLFDFKMDVDEKIMNQPILKLILQPLIENSLYHGLKPLDRKGHIWIKGRDDIDSYILRVSDDGVGIPDEVLSQLFNKRKTSFGLCGTLERLRIYTGAENCVKIISNKNGTCVTIILKKKELEDGEGIA